ncbi:MAG: hypothetical protein R3F30_12395 [Planctomycetota bacterium]
MNALALSAALLLPLSLLPAQTSVFYPDSTPSGSCNVIPFGSSPASTSTWGNQKYQSRVDKSAMPVAPQIITDLGFAPCGTGTSYFKTIKIQMGYTSSTTLSTTFAANLSKPVTVLDSREYRWHHTSGAFNRIGLQGQFLYIPANGHLVIDIEVTGAQLEVGTSRGFCTGTTIQRLFAFGWTGTAPATGSTDGGTTQAAQKVELVMTAADASIYGMGCQGSNGIPMLALTGTGKINSSLSIDLSNAPASSAAILLLGASSAPPLPIDLALLGAKGCLLAVGPDFPFAAPTDASGAASVKLSIPNDQGLVRGKLWWQWLPVDKQANQLGFTVSSFGRVLMGL